MSGCPNDIIIADTNVGTDSDPRMEVRVECNGPQECDFSEPFLDEDGDPHSPHDWWVIGADIKRYEKLHREHRSDL